MRAMRSKLLATAALASFAALLAFQLAHGRADGALLTSAELEETLGGAPDITCNNSVATPNACSPTGQAGGMTCWSELGPVCAAIAHNGSQYCGLVTLPTQSICTPRSGSNINCVLTTAGQCGNQYVQVLPLGGSCTPGGCNVPATPCGAPGTSTTTTNCS